MTEFHSTVTGEKAIIHSFELDNYFMYYCPEYNIVLESPVHCDDYDAIINAMREHRSKKPINISESPASYMASGRGIFTHSTFLSMDLMVTHECNLTCSYCYRKVSRTEASHRATAISIENVRKAIDFLMQYVPKKRKWKISFAGGEPFLNIGIMKCCMDYALSTSSQAKTAPCYFSVSTNGTLLDDHNIDELKGYPIKIQLSMDGMSDCHNKHRYNQNNQGTHQIVQESAKRLLENYKELNISATYLPGGPTIKERVEYFESLGVTRLSISPAMMASECSATFFSRCDYDVLLDEYRDYMMYLLEKRKKHMRIIYDPFLKYIGILAGSRPIGLACKDAAQSRLAVDIDGILYPCYGLVGMKQYTIGNIFNGLQFDKWHSFHERCVEAFRLCGQCWAWPLCGADSLCSTRSQSQTGQHRRRYCSYLRGFFQIVLEYYMLLVKTKINPLENTSIKDMTCE